MNAARSKLSGLMDTVAKHARPAVSAAEKEVTTRYSKIMKDNQEYVVKDQAHASKLMKQWWFTKLARWVARWEQLRPPLVQELWQTWVTASFAMPQDETPSFKASLPETEADHAIGLLLLCLLHSAYRLWQLAGAA